MRKHGTACIGTRPTVALTPGLIATGFAQR
jgi:hypothetical protein